MPDGSRGTRCNRTESGGEARRAHRGHAGREHRSMPIDSDDLRALVDTLGELASRRLAAGPVSDAARSRAVQLRDHVAGHLRPRAASLDAPVVVLLLGPTGAGKSTLFNTVAGRAASATGVLRPTTRDAVVLAAAGDRETLAQGSLGGVARPRLRFVPDAAEPGLVLIDAPDIDSIEHANRELADQLVEAADLAIFVTTATRYADRVPWAVLDRVRDRGLPLAVVVNRLPDDPADRADVLADVERLLPESGFVPPPEVVAVEEGRLAATREALEAAAIQPILDRIDGLRGDRDARRELAARALAGSLAGIGGPVDRVAGDGGPGGDRTAAPRRTARGGHRRGAGGLPGGGSRGRV